MYLDQQVEAIRRKQEADLVKQMHEIAEKRADLPMGRKDDADSRSARREAANSETSTILDMTALSSEDAEGSADDSDSTTKDGTSKVVAPGTEWNTPIVLKQLNTGRYLAIGNEEDSISTITDLTVEPGSMGSG